MWNSVGLWRERALLETAIEALDGTPPWATIAAASPPSSR